MKIKNPGKDLSGYLLDTASGINWQRIGFYKRSGVLAPLFSVYSKRSQGIGDLGDLKLLVDWAEVTGNSIIQLLPMNELGVNFCPYDSLSSFALEPSYLSLEQLLGTGRNSTQAWLDGIRKGFPLGNGRVNYQVKKEKIKLLQHIFSAGDNFIAGEFKKFLEDNAYWINDFSLFMVLKEHQERLPWYEWEAGYRNRNKVQLEAFAGKYEKEILFQGWLQWQLYKQFREAKAYAESKNVLIKGDLPVLVSRDSADVWRYPEFFKLEFAAGAPPDMYCAKGQRWGMPIYNWRNISSDGYRYLKERLKYAGNFYDILRIDHVVGLFRIWSIPYDEPPDNHGLKGLFDPPDESRWASQGREILSVMVENTRMLLCAEDLGVIPKACPEVLANLGIPGFDVQRWVKDWKIRHDFLKPDGYRGLSVATLSTHDTTNWAAWWENEVGTVDEQLFIRKCSQHKISYGDVKNRLFDPSLSRHGRLRWLKDVTTPGSLAAVLGKKREEIADLIDIYENTYQEKEKLWRHFGMDGLMQEESSFGTIRSAMEMTLRSGAIFCIQSIVDWLSLSDIFKGDPYQYRINTPGTVSLNNWSLVLPASLEELTNHKICQDIRELIITSGRLSEARMDQPKPQNQQSNIKN